MGSGLIKLYKFEVDKWRILYVPKVFRGSKRLARMLKSSIQTLHLDTTGFQSFHICSNPRKKNDESPSIMGIYWLYVYIPLITSKEATNSGFYQCSKSKHSTTWPATERLVNPNGKSINPASKNNESISHFELLSYWPRHHVSYVSCLCESKWKKSIPCICCSAFDSSRISSCKAAA